MSISQRQEQILELLREHRYLSVIRLSEIIYTSPSSIRRDLARLEALCLIKRSHGGAGILNEEGKAPPLDNRMSRNVAEKRKIAKKAAALLRDGQTVMLDGSSTSGFMVPYIAAHSGMTVYTNNMHTAMSAISHGIATHLIGGASVNYSAVLAGSESCRAVAGLCPDILFFSSQCLNADGVISDASEEENYLRSLMVASSKTTVFLCDSGKFGSRALHKLAVLDEIDYAVFDTPWNALSVKSKNTLV